MRAATWSASCVLPDLQRNHPHAAPSVWRIGRIAGQLGEEIDIDRLDVEQGRGSVVEGEFVEGAILQERFAHCRITAAGHRCRALFPEEHSHVRARPSTAAPLGPRGSDRRATAPKPATRILP